MSRGLDMGAQYGPGNVDLNPVVHRNIALPLPSLRVTEGIGPDRDSNPIP